MKKLIHIGIGLLLLINLFILNSNPGFAQEASIEDTKIPVIAYWDKGEIIKYRITKIKHSIKSNEPNQLDSSEYIATVKVLDSTATSYRISWNVGEIRKTRNQIPKSLIDLFLKFNINEIIYTTTETGVFTGIENWGEITLALNEVFNAINEKNKVYPDSIIEASQRIFEPFKRYILSKEGLEKLVFVEISLLHLFFGIDYEFDKPIPYKELFQFPIANENIRINGSFYIEGYDEKSDILILKNDSKLDPEDTRRAMHSMLSRINDGKNIVDTLMKKMNIQVNISGRQEIKYSSGIPKYTSSEKEIIMDWIESKSYTKETLKIELIDEK